MNFIDMMRARMMGGGQGPQSMGMTPNVMGPGMMPGMNAGMPMMQATNPMAAPPNPMGNQLPPTLQAGTDNLLRGEGMTGQAPGMSPMMGMGMQAMMGQSQQQNQAGAQQAMQMQNANQQQLDRMQQIAAMMRSRMGV